MFPPTDHAALRVFTRIVATAAIAIVLAIVLLREPPRGFELFDQRFYFTVAHDLDRYGVFSNGVFDATDSSVERPPPGMFFGPLYPLLLTGVIRIDERFRASVACAVAAQYKHRPIAECETYARPVLYLHALLLALGILCIGLAAELLLGGLRMFLLAAGVATLGILGEPFVFSFIMTEGLCFCLFSVTGYLTLAALRTGRNRLLAGCGIALGLLILARPVFVVLVPVYAALFFLAQRYIRRMEMMKSAGGILVFAAAAAMILLPWLARNQIVLGKFGLTEEYVSAVLFQRTAFNQMTLQEGVLAFPYCLPRIGNSALKRLGASDATDRFHWDKPGSFFQIASAKYGEAVAAHGRLDPVMSRLIGEELRRDWWRHLLVTLPLAWCGLWVGQIWSLLFVPLGAIGLAVAIRRQDHLLAVYFAPVLFMVALHAFAANGNTRYNLALIGPATVGALYAVTLLLNRRTPHSTRAAGG